MLNLMWLLGASSCCGEEVNPTGEVNAVCWKLGALLVAGFGLVITWLIKRLGEKEDKIEKLHDANLATRDKFEAQTLVWLNQIKDRKGTSP